jgi:hypothetical protein
MQQFEKPIVFPFAGSAETVKKRTDTVSKAGSDFSGKKLTNLIFN